MIVGSPEHIEWSKRVAILNRMSKAALIHRITALESRRGFVTLSGFHGWSKDELLRKLLRLEGWE